MLRSDRNQAEDNAVLKRSEEVYQVFLTELKKRGHTDLEDWSGDHIGEHYIKSVGGVSLEIIFSPVRNRTSYYRIHKDKLRIQIGHWEEGRKKQFPEPKAGFDWKKIIDYLEEYMEKRQARLNEKARSKASYKIASAAAEQIKETYNTRRIWLRAKEKSNNPEMDIELSFLSPENAERVVKLLTEELPDLFRRD